MSTDSSSFVDQLRVDDTPKVNSEKALGAVKDPRPKASLVSRMLRSWQLYVLVLPAVGLGHHLPVLAAVRNPDRVP